MAKSLSHHWFDVEKTFNSFEYRLLPPLCYKVSHVAIIKLCELRMDRFKVGSTPLSDEEISVFLGLPEAEFKAAKQQLVNREIFTLESDGTLVYPPIERLVRRQKVNQISGRMGGRGRKSSRTILKEKPAPKSDTETDDPNRRKKRGSPQLVARKLQASFSKEKEVAVATATTIKFTNEMVTQLAVRAAGIAGLDPNTSKAAHAVRQWLMMGADEGTIIRVVTNKQLPENPISSMHWYSPAMKAALGIETRGNHHAK